MFFQRCQIKAERRLPTPRRIAAANRAIQKDKDSVPLFPEMVKYTTAEERIAAKDAEFAKWVAGFRKFEADVWRRARAALRASPKKQLILDHWNRRIYPGDASHFASLVRRVINGQLDIGAHNRECERCRKLGEQWREQQALKELYGILAA